MRIVSLLILSAAFAVNSIAAVQIADEFKFFMPGVPIPVKEYHAWVCGAIFLFSLFFTIVSCLAVKAIYGIGTSHNPPA